MSKQFIKEVVLYMITGSCIAIALIVGFRKSTGSVTDKEYNELVNEYNELVEVNSTYESEINRVNKEITDLTDRYNSLVSIYDSTKESRDSLKETAIETGNIPLDQINVPDMKDGVIGWIYIPTCEISAYIKYGSNMKAISNMFVGEFEDTGELGRGNYCVLGHSNENKSYVFSGLERNINVGDPIYIYKDDTLYKFIVGYYRVVTPDNVWILTDTETGLGSCTIMCCTDEGANRFVVFGNYVEKLVINKE